MKYEINYMKYSQVSLGKYKLTFILNFIEVRYISMEPLSANH